MNPIEQTIADDLLARIGVMNLDINRSPGMFYDTILTYAHFIAACRDRAEIIELTSVKNTLR